MAVEDILYLGTHGHVRAVDKRSGEDLWTTSLPGTGFSIVTLLLEDGTLYAATSGHLFALDPLDGSIRWHNGLTGMGRGHICLLTSRSTGPSRAELLAAAAASDAAAGAAAAG